MSDQRVDDLRAVRERLEAWLRGEVEARDAKRLRDELWGLYAGTLPRLDDGLVAELLAEAAARLASFRENARARLLVIESGHACGVCLMDLGYGAALERVRSERTGAVLEVAVCATCKRELEGGL